MIFYGDVKFEDSNLGPLKLNREMSNHIIPTSSYMSTWVSHYDQYFVTLSKNLNSFLPSELIEINITLIEINITFIKSVSNFYH